MFKLSKYVDPFMAHAPVENFRIHAAEYQLKTWFISVLAYILIIASVAYIFRKKEPADKIVRSDKIIMGLLGGFWLWEGLIHQTVYSGFEAVTFYFMSIPFMLQAVLFVIFGLIKPSVSFKYEKESPYSQLGLFFIVYGLVIYPIVNAISAIGEYPHSPIVPLICPLTIVTLGFFCLMTPTYLPKFLLILPCYWAILGGGLAIVYWAVWGDMVLVVGGIIVPFLLVLRQKSGNLSYQST